jgi:2-dehydro-3-deoxyphosphogluconate aldolase / (4S)-4-hydroxy-2-oxoglutarate aldolase
MTLNTKEDTLSRIIDTGVVAVVRARDGRQMIDLTKALVAGGVEAIEITFTVPKANRVIERLADAMGEKIVLGAGSLLDAATARIAILSGAKFLVGPTVKPEVIEMGNRYALPVMPGAMTPTEALTAWELGASIVKVFPSETTGPGHLKAIHGPLPQIPLMPTGGVNLETAESFLKSGACALGIGGSLVSATDLAEGNFGRIESLARQYVEIVQNYRRSTNGS